MKLSGVCTTGKDLKGKLKFNKVSFTPNNEDSCLLSFTLVADDQDNDDVHAQKLAQGAEF